MMRRKLLLLNLLCWCSQISITYGQNLDSLILLSDDDSISYNERLASIGKVIKVYKQDFHFKYFPKLLSFEPIVGKCFSTEAQIEYYSKLYFYYLTSYKLDSCKLYLDKFQTIAIKSKSEKWIATLNFRRATFLGLHFKDSAIIEMDKALKYYKSVQNYSMLGSCYINLATIYRKYDLPQSAEYNYLAMKYLEKACSSIDESRAHNNLAIIFLDIGLPKEAANHLFKAYALVRGNSNVRLEVLYLNNLVSALLELNDFESAKIYSDLVFKIANFTNYPMYLMYSHINNANLYYKLNLQSQAIDEIVFMDSLHKANTFGGEVLAKFKLIEAQVYSTKFEHDIVINSCLTGLVHTTAQHNIMRLKFYDLLYKSYGAKGLKEDAANYLRKFIDTEELEAQNANSSFILRSELDFNFKKIDREFAMKESMSKQILKMEAKKFAYIYIVFLGLIVILIFILSLYYLKKSQSKSLLDTNEQISNVNESLKTINSKLETSNQELLNLAKSLSFKLEEPLQAIEAASKELCDLTSSKINDTSREQLNRISSSSKRMHGMIHHLFSLSVIDGSIKFDIVSMSELYVTVQEVCYELVKSSGATIVYKHSDEIVFCDKFLVSQVFQNIIANAIKYSQKEVSPFIKIGVVPERQIDFLTVYVSDNGIGISEDYFEFIFSPFKKIDNSDEKSFGIGLSTCKRIIEGFGGKIWVESVLNEGSTFYFQLPVSNISPD